MNLKVTVWVIGGFGILGILLVSGYLIAQIFKWGGDSNGSLLSARPTPAMTIKPMTTPTPVNYDQMNGNHTINLPDHIAPAGLPMHNLTPGITLTPSATRIIPPTPGLF
jgi:hypothetical protein